MAVTITYDGATPTIGADADTWGGELNTGALAKIKVDLDALAVQGNANDGALLKAGGTMTGDTVLADIAPGSIYSAGYRGLPVVSIDADRTFGLTDAGKMIRLTGTTARAWTLPPASSVAFPIGTVIVLRNAGTAAITVTRGSGVALRMVGSATDANRALAGSGIASVTLEAANSWVIAGDGVS